MDWGEDQNSVMLICTERRDSGPQAAESQCLPSSRLVQGSAAWGLPCWAAGAGKQRMWGRGWGRKEEPGLDSLCFIFQATLQVRAMA